MSVRSKFERDLSPGLRAIGFSIKIPDCSRARKPFDYVVGVEQLGKLKFVGIEAKKADGWGLSRHKWEPHQRKSLGVLSNIDIDSSWVAIGFLDLPRMKRGPDLRKLNALVRAEAFLITWADFLSVEGEKSCRYTDLVYSFRDCQLGWEKPLGKTRYSWMVPKTHKILF